MITLVDDSKKASLEKKTNSLLKEINNKIQLILESLAKKTSSRSLKSLNHFFHREITFLRNFCDLILQDLNDIQDSTDVGMEILIHAKCCWKKLNFWLSGGSHCSRQMLRLLGTTIRKKLSRRVDFEETVFSCDERIIFCLKF